MNFIFLVFRKKHLSMKITVVANFDSINDDLIKSVIQLFSLMESHLSPITWTQW